MKTLRFATHWTAEEADCMLQFIDELKSILWQQYGDEIVDMHRAIKVKQQKFEESNEFDDEISF